jgi:hypothetical protein
MYLCRELFVYNKKTIMNTAVIEKPRYIDESLRYYDSTQCRSQLATALRKESNAVQESSMEVLLEFEKIDLC